MVKESYVEAEMELILFQGDDIVTASEFGTWADEDIFND